MRSLLLGSFLLAFLVRFAWQLHVDFYGHPEVWEYDTIARNLLAGRGYVIDFLGTSWVTFATPVYPFLLAALHLLGGPDDYRAIGVAQDLLSAATVPLTYLLARRFAGPIPGAIAAVVVMLHPGLVIYAAKVHEVNLATPIGALIVLTAIRVYERPTMTRSVVNGLTTGVTWLLRPTVGLYGLLSLFVVARTRSVLLVSFALALAVTVPWSVRNAVATGGLGTPLNCVSLWIGNNEASSGGALTVDGTGVVRSMPAELRSRIEGRPEAEQGRVFCDEAIRFLASDPVRTLGWWATKLGYFWWFAPEAGVFYPAGWIDAYRVAWTIELALIAGGVAIAWRRSDRRLLLLVLAQLAIVSLSQSFFYVEGRHRLMLEPLLASLAALPPGLVAARPIAGRGSPVGART